MRKKNVCKKSIEKSKQVLNRNKKMFTSQYRSNRVNLTDTCAHPWVQHFFFFFSFFVSFASFRISFPLFSLTPSLSLSSASLHN